MAQSQSRHNKNRPRNRNQGTTKIDRAIAINGQQKSMAQSQSQDTKN
jgi:hypothetical protein